MSIIQDALKKVSNTPAGPGEPAKNVTNSPETPNRKVYNTSRRPKAKVALPAISIFVLLVLIFLGTRHFSNVESIYKPLSTAGGFTVEPYESPSSVKGLPAKKDRTSFSGFILSGVMQLIDGPRAIINDVVVGVGDVVNGAIVQKISKDGVILKKKDSQIALNME